MTTGMARHVEGPWYRAGKNTWYVTHEGRNVSLGIRGRENRKAAFAAWHRLIAGRSLFDPPEPKPKPAVLQWSTSLSPSPVLTVRELAELFLTDAGTRLKATTVRIYRNDVESLCKAHGKLAASALTPDHLTKWLASLDVVPTTKGIMLRSVAACLSWAVKSDLIPANPARKVKKPKSRSRSAEAVISDADHAKLVAAATPDFASVLRVLHATGCRPSEACAITSETFDPVNAVVKLLIHKTDHTGRPRLVFLTADVVGLLTGQLARFGSGSLLRSRKGVPWTGRGITQAMRKLCQKAGVKCIAYGYRHKLATDALASGIPDTHVAALLGHGSTTVLHKHYSHLTSRADVLRDAASKVRG